MEKKNNLNLIRIRSRDKCCNIRIGTYSKTENGESTEEEVWHDIKSEFTKGDNDLPYLTFDALEHLPWLRHGFSTRLGGVSEGIFSSMNLVVKPPVGCEGEDAENYKTGEEYKKLKENFRRIGEAMGMPYNTMVHARQTHTANVQVITEEIVSEGGLSLESGLLAAEWALRETAAVSSGKADNEKNTEGSTEETGKEKTSDKTTGEQKPKYDHIDGLVTNLPGVTLVTAHADCIPLYLADPVKKAIGLLHAGWKGTLYNIASEGLRLMRENYGTNPADVIAVAGPGICGSCYEVDGEVAEKFFEAYGDVTDGCFASEACELTGKSFVSEACELTGKSFASEACELTGKSFAPEACGLSGSRGECCVIKRKPNGKAALDLHLANAVNLRRAGVLPEHIHLSDVCTMENAGLLFSHRATGGRRGGGCAFLRILPEPVQNPGGM